MGNKSVIQEQTIRYYDMHAADFIESTVSADMKGIYSRFEACINPGASILDLGCGSGRDSKYFYKEGYKVIAVDPSLVMCENTRALAPIEVLQMKAENISWEEEFNAIWACASLLHIRNCELEEVLHNLYKALRPNGVLYASWKYGDTDIVKNGRFFSYQNELSIKCKLQNVGFSRIEGWITEDNICTDRDKWLNVLAWK